MGPELESKPLCPWPVHCAYPRMSVCECVYVWVGRKWTKNPKRNWFGFVGRNMFNKNVISSGSAVLLCFDSVV